MRPSTSRAPAPRWRPRSPRRSHAYLFAGPAGSGKRSGGAGVRRRAPRRRAPPTPTTPRRRALADPVAAPRPDLARPPGTQHLVDEVRERVIAAAAYRPVRGRAPRVRDRGRRGDGRGEPERAAEDARGAGRLRPPAADQLRARGAARDGALALPAGALRARSPTRPSRQRLAERGLGDGATSAAPPPGWPAATRDRAAFLVSAEGRELRAAAARLRGARARRRAGGAPWPRLVAAAEARRRAAPASEARRRGSRRSPPRPARPRDAPRGARRARRRRPARVPRGAPAPRRSTSASALLARLASRPGRRRRGRRGAGAERRSARGAREAASGLDARARARAERSW